MASPERLNVLLSRARDGLIMIGNAETFLASRKGKKLWTQLFGLLKQRGHVYEGFPVICERHPKTTAILREASDFDNECPDGGCKEPWSVSQSYCEHRKTDSSAVELLSTAVFIFALNDATSYTIIRRSLVSTSFTTNAQRVIRNPVNVMFPYQRLVQNAKKRLGEFRKKH